MTTSSSMESPSVTPVEALTYEQALAELEGIVAALESGDHSLESALAFYERGQTLARYCTRLLEQAELKVQSLSGDELADVDKQID
jgi:exodeoxyribonuclease VII small subunit